ncbi:hypothetical protein Angca_010132, partial [Angiostrongylus cantonensis]
HRQIYGFDLGHSAAGTARNTNEVSGGGIFDESIVRTWLQKSQTGEYHLEDEEAHGRPREFDDNDLKSPVEANTRATVRELAEQLGVSMET